MSRPKRPKPDKIVFHEDGSFSLRWKNDWHRNITSVSDGVFLQLPSKIRKKITYYECDTGRVLTTKETHLLTLAECPSQSHD